jgi:DNA processing protein
MVGARNGSAVGQKFTRQLATELGLEGFLIASGLARGIIPPPISPPLSEAPSPCSQEAHRRGLSARDADLQRAIGEHGLLLT